jgi:hypothetical protein
LEFSAAWSRVEHLAVFVRFRSLPLPWEQKISSFPFVLWDETEDPGSSDYFFLNPFLFINNWYLKIVSLLVVSGVYRFTLLRDLLMEVEKVSTGVAGSGLVVEFA